MPELEPNNTQLAVFFGDQLVGQVFDSAPLSFSYSDAWLARPETAQIAANTPEAGPISNAAVTAFLENLLPEGELRRFIASSKKGLHPVCSAARSGGRHGGWLCHPANGSAPHTPEGVTATPLFLTVTSRLTMSPLFRILVAEGIPWHTTWLTEVCVSSSGIF